MPDLRMVADVGGTNTRIALFDKASGEYRALGNYHNRDFDDFADVIASWLQELIEPAPGIACIALAAPPGQDQVNMFNMDWSFSRRELAGRFDFEHIAWLNDFEGNAHSLPYLTEKDRILLYSGVHSAGERLATVGPGTGLGGATLHWHNGQAYASACEPGHMGLSPETDLELELFRLLLPQYKNIYAELLVSGPGLERLYQSIAEIRGEPFDDLTPAQISSSALAGEDQACIQALETFSALLGSVCGDFVVTTGSYGGLYLAGGIVPRMIDFLMASDFINRLQHKGAMIEHLERVPVYAITASQPGLIGAAHAPI